MKKKVISPTLNKKLKQIKGFRNIIVHKYGDVDDALAFEYLSSGLGDFYEAKETVLKYLKAG